MYEAGMPNPSPHGRACGVPWTEVAGARRGLDLYNVLNQELEKNRGKVPLLRGLGE